MLSALKSSKWINENAEEKNILKCVIIDEHWTTNAEIEHNEEYDLVFFFSFIAPLTMFNMGTTQRFCKYLRKKRLLTAIREVRTV